MDSIPAPERPTQFHCAECGAPTSRLRGDGFVYCSKHRSVASFWSPGYMRLVLLDRYYELLNQNPEFLAQLVPLLEGGGTVGRTSRFPVALQTEVERLAGRWGIPLDYALTDVRHSADLLSLILASGSNNPVALAEARKLSTGGRISSFPELSGDVGGPVIIPALSYDPRGQSPMGIRKHVRQCVRAIERHLLDQVEEIEARAKASGYVDPRTHRRQMPAESKAMVRRAYRWWALQETEAEIAACEQVEEDTVHKSVLQWKRHFTSIPRRPAKR